MMPNVNTCVVYVLVSADLQEVGMQHLMQESLEGEHFRGRSLQGLR